MLKFICLVLSLATFCSAEEASEGEFNGNLFEGDLILPPSLSRAGRITNRWPGGIFYYRLTSGLTSESRAMDAIRAAMQEWEQKTCIRFRERTNEPAFVEFVTGRGGCWSNGIGRNGNRMQTINLDPACWGKGTVVHEIGHALGFWHEQSRPDRDDYITIMWQNIKSGMESQFKMMTHSSVDSMGSPYDYNSVMHYPDWAFQKARGLKTIIPKQSGVTIGNREGLSVEDARQMNSMYKKECDGGGGQVTRPPITQRPTSGGSCRDKNPSCRQWTRYCRDSRYQAWMRDNCASTCGFCSITRPPITQRPTSDCEDSDRRCRGWVSYCRTHDYVRRHCKKTCRFC